MGLTLKQIRGHIPLRVVASLANVTEAYVCNVELGKATPNDHINAAYVVLASWRRDFTYVAEALADAQTLGAREAYNKLRADIEWSGYPHLLRDIRGVTPYEEVMQQCGCSQAVVYSFESPKPKVRISEKLLYRLLAKYAAMEAAGNTLTYDRDVFEKRAEFAGVTLGG